MKYLLPLLASVSLYAEQNKVICIMSTPRSLSTVMLRSFANRDDFITFNEPAVALYGREYQPEYTKDWFNDDEMLSYSEMKEKLLKASDDSHVISKVGSFLAEPFIMAHDDFILNPKVHFVFLTRDPYRIALSMYKALGFAGDVMFRTLATKQLYNIFQKVNGMSPNQVHFICTEDLLENPERELRKLFNDLDIPFSEKSLSWESKDETYAGKDWHEQKNLEQFQRWHGAALRSTHINPTPKKIRPAEDQMFLGAKTKEDRDLLMKVYKYHLPYYELLLKAKDAK